MNNYIYVFDNLNTLAGYIKKCLSNPTPLKIQKSLYFLWAFYSATFGNISSDDSKNGLFGLYIDESNNITAKHSDECFFCTKKGPSTYCWNPSLQPIT